MNDLRQWRAEQIAGNLLYNTEEQIIIENTPIQLFDLLVTIKDTSYRFGVEVKSSTFTKSEEYPKLLSQLKIYKSNNMINIPLLLFCINSNNETGTFDFIAKPTNGEIGINEDISLKKITPETLSSAITTIKNYYNEKRNNC